MIKKTPVEMERARTIKVTRTVIRLKYSCMADDEINELLPARLAQFDKDIHAGDLRYLPIPTLDEVLDEVKTRA